MLEGNQVFSSQFPHPGYDTIGNFKTVLANNFSSTDSNALKFYRTT